MRGDAVAPVLSTVNSAGLFRRGALLGLHSLRNASACPDPSEFSTQLQYFIASVR